MIQNQVYKAMSSNVISEMPGMMLYLIARRNWNCGSEPSTNEPTILQLFSTTNHYYFHILHIAVA